jgi:hypothetical protein
MPVAFGISIGDIIASIKLIDTIVSSVNGSKDSGSEYRGLIAELDSLRTALESVRTIKSDDEIQKIALDRVASQCGQTIAELLSRIIKYQPSLGDAGSGYRWKDNIRKIQWNLQNKDEIHRFQAEIQGHVASMHILIEKIHM